MTTNTPAAEPLIVVVMGVSGCGKSTVAALLADQIEGHFKDGDELHPDSNIKKMAAGIALQDADRLPWLHDVADYAREQAKVSGVCVIACSALKYQYRHILNQAGHVVYIFLQGSRKLIASRMHERRGHFMPETLLDSQFSTLENPRDEPNVLCVNIEPEPGFVAITAANTLRAHGYIKANQR